MQVNRLFEIVYILLGKKIVTAKELAERFGVSQRTIYRDIDALSLSGVPVYAEKGRAGGISLLPEYVLDKSILNQKEQTEILSALQGVNKVTQADAGNVIKKLSGMFKIDAVDWLEVDFSDWSNDDGDGFNDIKNAIIERRVVEFDYYNSLGEKSRRRTEPLQLWFKHRSWYLRAYCLDKRDFRVFKLTRINNHAVTDERFIPRLQKPVPETDDTQISSGITITLKISPQMAYRVYDAFGTGNFEVLQDGSFLVTVTWPEDEWFYGQLLSFGEYLEVLSPLSVREKIKDKLLKSIAKYDTL